MCSTNILTSPVNNALSNHLHNNAFLPGFSSSPCWLLVIRSRGDWWCRHRGHCRSGPRHRSPLSRVCAQETHRKDIHSHILSHSPIDIHNTKSKTFNSLNMWRPFCSTLPVQCGGGRLSGSLADAPQECSTFPTQCCCGRQPRSLADVPQDCSTSEAFSPRTVTEKKHLQMCSTNNKTYPAIMHFLTTSTITLSWLASAAPQAESCWLGHVEPDYVVIADIAGQALNIFLHGPVCAQECHSKDIHSHIHSHTPMHTHNTNKEQNTQLTKHVAFFL